MTIAILTCQSLPNLNTNDQLLISAFAKNQITAQPAVWSDSSIDWQKFDYLIFRSTWDYFEREAEFNLWLAKIEKLGVKTLNSLQIINQNKHKFYLKSIEKQGVKIVPTVFIDKTTSLDLNHLIPADWQKCVIKPAFSGAAYQTTVFDVANTTEINNIYLSIAAEKELLLQRFMPEIQTLGETSLIFFNKKYSHAVNKKPVSGDFRVQSQFGGTYTAVAPTASIIEKAQNIVHTFYSDLLYLRIDGIIIGDEFYLMEIEGIEPDLYFEHAAPAIDLFVAAFLEIIN